jgi:hypothetical protein
MLVSMRINEMRFSILTRKSGCDGAESAFGYDRGGSSRASTTSKRTESGRRVASSGSSEGSWQEKWLAERF